MPRRVPYGLLAGASGWRCLWLSILEGHIPGLGHAERVLKTSERDELAGVVAGILREARRLGAVSEGVAPAYARVLAALVSRQLGAGGRSVSGTFGALVERIEAAPAEAWDAAAMAAVLGRSQRQAHRIIARHALCTPAELLTRLRLGIARRLLRLRSARLEAVAQAVGYATAASFSHAFRRSVGVSPGRWREGL
jgi:AraC-like DNA-binding protein